MNMVNKVAIDTNILLDLLIKDRPGNAMAKTIFAAAENGMFKAQITTQSIMDAAYSSRKSGLSFEKFTDILSHLRVFVEIQAIDWIDLSWATAHYSGDFEDDAQYANAYNSVCDFFITRDKKLMELNNKFNPMTVISPENFVAAMKA